MDPTEINWIEKYFEQRQEFDFTNDLPSEKHFEQLLYKYLQPSGIIYGHPIDLPPQINIDTKDWPVKERLEVILFEGLLAAYLLKKNLKGSVQELNNAAFVIKQFYDKLNPELVKKSFFERKTKNDLQSLERIFAKRVKVKAEWNNTFWQGFFHNILLFGDIITFIHFLENTEITDSDLLEFELKLHRQILHMLSVIINIDKDTKEQNIRYYHYFVESTILPKDEKKLAWYWHDKAFCNEFETEYKESDWLQKRYMLDLAALSVWADKTLTILEKEFLDTVAKQLRLDQIDLEASGFAVESFVLNNWNKVYYLQQKQSYLVLSRRIASRMKKISIKYGAFIKQEIEEDKELLSLLKLSHDRPLSIEEKDIVRRQLLDILKMIPTISMLALPMAYLTVPILMKVIPKEFFPSSFNPNALTVSRDKGRSRIVEG